MISQIILHNCLFQKKKKKKTKGVNEIKNLLQDIYLNVRWGRTCKHFDAIFFDKVSIGLWKVKQNELIGFFLKALMYNVKR